MSEQKRRAEAIGDMAAGVARELRSPLFAISSAAQLLRFHAQEDPVVEKNVGRILREVERLNQMATSLVEFGRAAAMQPRPGDPDLVWDDVLGANRGMLESRALLLHRTRSDRAARALLDPERLAQAFTKLLVNAAEAAPEASDLTLTSTIMENGSWRCQVQNGGPPIPPQMLERAFEIFFSTRAGGTGMGLALAQRIIQELGGDVMLDSSAEAGTVATVTLPGV